jgi:hypothetical protein
MNRMSERETVVSSFLSLTFCPCVEKLRTVLPLTVGIRDGVVQLVSILGSAAGVAGPHPRRVAITDGHEHVAH